MALNIFVFLWNHIHFVLNNIYIAHGRSHSSLTPEDRTLKQIEREHQHSKVKLASTESRLNGFLTCGAVLCSRASTYIGQDDFQVSSRLIPGLSGITTLLDIANPLGLGIY